MIDFVNPQNQPDKQPDTPLEKFVNTGEALLAVKSGFLHIDAQEFLRQKNSNSPNTPAIKLTFRDNTGLSDMQTGMDHITILANINIKLPEPIVSNLAGSSSLLIQADPAKAEENLKTIYNFSKRAIEINQSKNGPGGLGL